MKCEVSWPLNGEKVADRCEDNATHWACSTNSRTLFKVCAAHAAVVRKFKYNIDMDGREAGDPLWVCQEMLP